MGIAALVIGIVSLIVGFIPFCNIFALIPAAAGLVLGIIDWVMKKKAGKAKGVAIAGTICSGIAIVIILIYYFAVVVVANKAAGSLKDWADSYDWNYSIDSSDYNYDSDY